MDKTLVSYRLLDPGSERRLHHDWFKTSTMADLLGKYDSIAAKDTLYRCLDRLGEHKTDLLSSLKTQWGLLFNASYDVLLYDLTSTYFECDMPEHEGLRRFGYNRNKRSDCVQVVLVLTVTSDSFRSPGRRLRRKPSDSVRIAKNCARRGAEKAPICFART